MLLFRDRFVQPIVTKQKDVTRRGNPEWKLRMYKPGSIHKAYVTPPWTKGEPFATLRIISVTIDTFGKIIGNHEEARREGFKTLQEFHEYIGEKGASLDEPLARIEFELVSVNKAQAERFIARSKTW